MAIGWWTSFGTSSGCEPARTISPTRGLPVLEGVAGPASGELRDVTPRSERWFDFMEPTGQDDISPDGANLVYFAIPTSNQIVRVGVEPLLEGPGK